MIEKCSICGKEIQRGLIPRIEPQILEMQLKDDKKRPVCDACGNLLAIVIKMMK